MKPALESAGYDKSKGVVTAQYLKDPTDPGWADDAGMKEFQAWRAKYAPESDPANPVWAYGYTMAQALVVVLKQAGDDLTRENILKARDEPAGHDETADWSCRGSRSQFPDGLPADEEHAAGSVRREDVSASAG